MVSPANSSTQEVFDEINFEWEPVENATYYILDIVANPPLSIRTEEPRATIRDLGPNEFSFSGQSKLMVYLVEVVMEYRLEDLIRVVRRVRPQQ